MHWYEYLVLILGTGLLGAVVQILLSNFLSLNMSKIEKQKEVYNEFLLQLQEVAVPNSRDNTFNLVVARNKVLLYASIKTAELINSYVNELVIAQKTPISREKQDDFYSKIIHSMRKDLKLGDRRVINDLYFIVAQKTKKI